MGDFPVRPEKEEALRRKMAALGIREKDIVEKFIRSGGRGGQRANKSSTCVYLRHVPTQVEVKCSLSRSQALNRFLARRILTEKIEKRVRGGKSAEEQRMARIRRQKKRSSRRARLKMPNFSCL